MTPNDPLSEEPQYAEVAEAAPPVPPFWDYLDLGFLASFCLPALLFSALIVKIFSRVLPGGKPFQSLLIQLVWYALVFGSLYALLHVRYHQPFWRSLAWKVAVPGAAASLFAGPVLAIAIGFVGSLLRTPEVQTPFQQMLRDRPTMILFAILVVVLGPLSEELAFRGFLMPLLVRSLGAAPGIVLTGLLFGALHGYEYSWSWRHILLIALAGTVFGWVRYKTGSTAVSTFMHSTYNLTQFAGFLAQSGTI